MRHRLSPILFVLSALSLVLIVVVIAACVRGKRTADWLEWHRTDPIGNQWRAVDVVIGKSGIYASWQWFEFDTPGKALEYAQRLSRVSGLAHTMTPPQPNPFADGGSFWNRAGFGYELSGVSEASSSDGTYRFRFDNAHVPYWALILVFSAAGTHSVRTVFARRRRGRRAAAGRCPSCGYDLRATPDRCPECGAFSQPPATTAA